MTKDEGPMTKEAPSRLTWMDSAPREELTFWGEPIDSCERLVLRDESPAKIYDLAERTSLFGEAVIRFAKRIPDTAVNHRIIGQLVGSGISVGANYCEADDACSKKEFRQKIGYCRKEARETKFHLRMVATAEPCLKEEARTLWREARELHLIFCAILRKP